MQSWLWVVFFAKEKIKSIYLALTGRSVPYQSQRSLLSWHFKRLGVATQSNTTHNLYASSATEAKGKAFVTWRDRCIHSQNSSQWWGSTSFFIHLVGSIISVVISVLPLFWETQAGDEPSWDNMQRKKKGNLPAAVRAATCARLWTTGFIPLQACLSQYGGSWLLNGNTWPYASLLSRSDFTGLPSQHPPAVFYAATLAPTPHPLFPHPPFTHSLPPVRSLQLDPLRMTPSQSA